MKKSCLLGAVCACLAAISINANAIVVNTLNGVNYQWLELTETAGMSRLAVEAQLSDVNSTLYGYEYASRSLVEDLLLSYSSWDGLNGYHNETINLTGIEKYFDDFGTMAMDSGDGINDTHATVDGGLALYDAVSQNSGLFGEGDECGLAKSCFNTMVLYADASGNLSMALQEDHYGWDETVLSVYIKDWSDPGQEYGSYLVKVSTVPIPAALWLFGSGLLALVGMARRKA